MDGWGARQFAVEGAHFRAEEKLAVERHLQKLVEEGRLPASTLDSLLGEHPARPRASVGAVSGVPTVRRTRPASEFVYEHVRGRIPGNNLPSMKDWGLGSSVSLGRGRWSVDNVSIFSVEEGKRLASTPSKEPTVFEIKRAEAIQRAASETQVVHGFRLYPTMTPGRAFLWGTIVACTGMAIGTKAAMLALEIKQLDDVALRLRQVLHPYAEYLSSAMEPWRGLITAAGERADAHNSVIADVARRLKDNLQEH